MFKPFFISLIAATFAAASGKPGGGVPVPNAPPEVRVLSEVQPAGGTVQVKLSLTEPRPIITGTTSAFLDGGSFDSIFGVAVFSPTGDVFGTAVVKGTAVQVNYTSPNGTFGMAAGYPIVTIAAHVRDDAALGHVAALGDGLTLAGSSSTQAYAFVIKPGTLSIGGSVSIHNVVPGGGSWPAGTVVHLTGNGFQNGTAIKATVNITSVTVVSPTHMTFVLRENAVMDGVRLDLKNPDGSSDSYYSYLRGERLTTSVTPLFNATLPVFSSLTYQQASIVQGSAGIRDSLLTGLAMQNPGQLAANVQLQALSPFGTPLATVQLSLPPRGQLLQGLGEYFGSTLPANSTVKATSDQPIQFLGISVDQAAGTAAAYAVGR